MRADRNKIIRNELTSFNNLNEAGARRDHLVQKLDDLMMSQSSKVRSLINSMRDDPKSYVDFERLVEDLVAGKDITDDTSLLIDTDRLISDVKQNKGPQAIRDTLLNQPIDVQSIYDARQASQSDSSISAVEKAQIQSLLAHIDERTKFISNARRESITVGQYLAEHDASSASAFADYANGLLRQKLISSLGKGREDGDIIDWDVNGVRTQPVDHKIDDIDSKSLLKNIIKGNESLNEVDKLVKTVDAETGIEDVRSMRDHA